MKRFSVTMLVGLILLAEIWLVFRARESNWVALFEAERIEGDVSAYFTAVSSLPWETLEEADLDRVAAVIARMDEGTRSVNVLQRLLELRPDDRSLRWELATRLAEDGRNEEAAPHYDHLLHVRRDER